MRSPEATHKRQYSQGNRSPVMSFRGVLAEIPNSDDFSRDVSRSHSRIS
jgi:hypothetical protein